jgi:tRNA A37 N6-isopentenylltransferase MiaA
MSKFPNEETQFKKGKSGNPNGRPRKYVSLLKEHGYKLSEVNDTIQAMMAMSMDELKAVWDNQDATVLEKTIANAMRKSIEKGSLYSIETLLSRVYGNPKQMTELTGANGDPVQIIISDKL